MEKINKDRIEHLVEEMTKHYEMLRKYRIWGSTDGTGGSLVDSA